VVVSAPPAPGAFGTGRNDGSLAVLHTLGCEVISHGGLGRSVVDVLTAKFKIKFSFGSECQRTCKFWQTSYNGYKFKF
jgi:hypothetical protein